MSVWNKIKKVVLALLVIVSITSCKKEEVEKEINIEEDIPLFKNFVEENIDKVSNDPYISSTVKPDDEMYDLMLMLQRGDWSQTTWDEMDSLMKKGVENAKIIYARTKIDEIYKRSEATAILTELMRKGNPYATYWLSSKSNLCLSYLSSEHFGNKVAKELGLDTSYENKYCTEEIYQKAVEGFKRLAAEGDLHAQYFLLKEKGLDKSVEKREEYIKEVIRFAKYHYYKPLMDYYYNITKVENGKTVFYSPRSERQVKKLLRIAANNNYIPAFVFLIDKNTPKDDFLYNRLKKLGAWHYFWAKPYYKEKSLNPKEQYCDAKLYKAIFGDRFFGGRYEGKIDMSNIKCNISEQLNSVEPMIYIDYFTRIDDWSRGY
ncbi:hypothetical protein BZJ19_14005 [Salinivibrio proteolyticus]|uniref:hypothetical protein n=1 Tax=Salinivibrio proteolyticus TaxID=334715 RepID=UPI0009892373|nr:hypothetical protein [Salinivibrio proteolyticus]OOF23021.1 hypothetical protein BZJ19_14005 [Salinivibrio proteolyticus]